MGWDLRICISNKLPGDANALGPKAIPGVALSDMEIPGNRLSRQGALLMASFLQGYRFTK